MSFEFLEIGGTVENGRIRLDDEAGYRRAVGQFGDGRVTVRIERERHQRSNQQNRFWHGVVVKLFAEHCGYDFYDMKDTLALELIPKEVYDIKTGEMKIVPGHTSALNTKEFNALIERAQRLGAEMGIDIPNPGELVAA